MQESVSPEHHKTQDPTETNLFKQLFTVLGLGVLVATFFTAWMPIDLIANSLAGKFGDNAPLVFEPSPAEAVPTPTSRPRPRIGLVAGHWGNDAGAVCDDDLTEAAVNLNIATLVQNKLFQAGFDVDLLKEFDPLLSGYRALALISIHADSCTYINDLATGYKVAAALSTTNPNKTDRLTACIRSRYAGITGLPYHGASVTADMTSYHAFEEIHFETPAVIIETGFLNLDRQILTQQPDKVAEGITQGVLCYIYNEDISSFQDGSQ